MEEQFNTAELNEMKEQISLLRRKLEKETIVNEKLIRRSLSDKVKGIKRISYVVYPFVIGTCFIWKKFAIHLSPYFIWTTIVFLLIAMAYDLYCNHLLNTQNIICGNLLDEAYKLARYKRLRQQWERYGIFFLCAWVSWFIYESLNGGAYGSMFSGLVGGSVGGYVGWKHYKKEQNTVNEVIEQIEELTEEKE